MSVTDIGRTREVKFRNRTDPSASEIARLYQEGPTIIDLLRIDLLDHLLDSQKSRRKSPLETDKDELASSDSSGFDLVGFP